MRKIDTRCLRRGSFIVLGVLLILYFVYRFFFLPIMYDTYENYCTKFENRNVRVESSIRPAYDYSSCPILFAHYRGRYHFNLDIKSKTSEIVQARITKSDLTKNGASSDFIGSGQGIFDGPERINMDINELEITNLLSKRERTEKSIEEFRFHKKFTFKSENHIERDGCYISFEIPIDYKKDETVEIILDISFLFDDGHEEIVEILLGGKKYRYIMWLKL